MDPGDLALFAREGRIFSVGTVVKKLHNSELARELWKEDEDGHTWEYMYFLTGIHPVSISYEEFNVAAGYAERNVIQGFSVLSEEKSITVLATLNLIEQQTPNEKALAEIRTVVVESGEFDPSSEIDGRRRALAAIVRRQGQPEFRKRLIQLYSGRCAISGCDAIQTLEAAHIVPYNGPGTNHPANGLLLRADLHVLFDLGLIAVDPSTFTVILKNELRNTSYADLEGRRLSLPSDLKLQPSSGALARHLENSGL
jgi:predicted restriction endonuclease